MEIEFLKKAAQTLSGIKASDIVKSFSEIDTQNPVVLFGLLLISAGAAIFMLYTLSLLFFSSPRTSALSERSLFNLSSRVTALELLISELKSSLKHMSQQSAADKVAFKAEISDLKQKIKSAKHEGLHLHGHKKAA
jgi:hypothetical protein